MTENNQDEMEWQQHQEELDWILDELMVRADEKNANLSAVALIDMHESGDIEALRFHHLHWDASSSSLEGVSLSVSAVTHKAALILGEDPLSFVTDEHFGMVRRFFRVGDRKTLGYTRNIELAPYVAILLKYPEREEFLTHLIVERGVTTVEGLRGVMESSDGLPLVMNQGAL